MRWAGSARIVLVFRSCTGCPSLRICQKGAAAHKIGLHRSSKDGQRARKQGVTNKYASTLQLKAGNHVYLQDSVKGGQTDFNITCPMG